MSILGDIVGAIFGTGSASATEAQPAPAGSSATAKSTGSGTAAATSNVDVAAILDKKAKAAGEKLNWRKSIVDLMKLLDLDSSFAARKELAKELGYTGDSSDSASMNVWLHKQVMAKLAASGGKVPEDLRT